MAGRARDPDVGRATEVTCSTDRLHSATPYIRRRRDRLTVTSHRCPTVSFFLAALQRGLHTRALIVGGPCPQLTFEPRGARVEFLKRVFVIVSGARALSPR